MYGRILKSLNIVNLHQEMFKLKLKINVKVPQLLCIVVSVALNGEFERFSGFCVDFFSIATVDAKPTKLNIRPETKHYFFLRNSFLLSLIQLLQNP